MEAQDDSDAAPGASYVSTGHLPRAGFVMAAVAEAHAAFKDNADGVNSAVYPALARVPRDLFGICVMGTTGNRFAVGDATHEFSIMSVSKPFVFALVCQALGAAAARDALGGWRRPVSTKLPATGLTMSGCRARAESAAGS